MTEWKGMGTAPIESHQDKDRWYKKHSPRLLLWVEDRKRVEIGFYEYTRWGKGRWVAGGKVVRPQAWMYLPDGYSIHSA